jgi:hypothetical protein
MPPQPAPAGMPAEESPEQHIARVFEFVDLMLWGEQMIATWRPQWMARRARSTARVDYATIVENPREIVELAVEMTVLPTDFLATTAAVGEEPLPSRLRRDDELYRLVLQRLPLSTNAGTELTAQWFRSRFVQAGGARVSGLGRGRDGAEHAQGQAPRH